MDKDAEANPDCEGEKEPISVVAEPPVAVILRPSGMALALAVLGALAVVEYAIWITWRSFDPLVFCHPFLLAWVAGYWVRTPVTRCLLFAGVFVGIFLYCHVIEDIRRTRCGNGFILAWATSYMYLFAVLLIEKCMQEAAAWRRRRAAPAP